MVEVSGPEIGALYVGSFVAAYLFYPRMGDESMDRATWAAMNAAVPAVGFLVTKYAQDPLRDVAASL